MSHDAAANLGSTVSVADHGADPTGQRDATLAVRRALEHARCHGASRVEFPHGRYRFAPARAAELTVYPSNNDGGLKRVAMPLHDRRDLVVDGHGSTFVFEGRTLPLLVERGRGVVLRNFSIDWERPFFNQAEVLATGDDWADLRMDEAFPYAVERRRLLFTGPGYESRRLKNVLEFDPARREPAPGVWDNFELAAHARAEERPGNVVRLHGPWRCMPRPGRWVVLHHYGRECPAIVLSDCRDVRVEDVCVHHAGGMGLIAQRCHDVRLRRYATRLPEASPRLVTCTADATHFVGCTGTVELDGCWFENQLDDATNVHGAYARLVGRLDAKTLEAEMAHPQQAGFEFCRPGERLSLIDFPAMRRLADAEVVAVEPLNPTRFLITLDAPLPAPPAEAVIENRTTYPDLLVHGCTARRNRARGLLASTAGRVRIERNHFHVPGAAVMMSGGYSHWHESGAVRDVWIGGNTFDRCLTGVWGRAVIQAEVTTADGTRSGVRHRGIVIEGNTFRCLDAPLLHTFNAEQPTLRDNTMVPADPAEAATLAAQ